MPRVGFSRIPFGAEQRDGGRDLAAEPTRADWQVRFVGHVVGGETVDHPNEQVARLRHRTD